MPLKNKVDSDEKTKILKDLVIDFLYMHESLQQDNAPAHTSMKTKKIWEIGFTLLDNWPVQSLISTLSKFVECSEEKHL